MAFSVLFVCTGNSCRSPMAEGILESMIPEERTGKIQVGSAGTANLEGMPATQSALEVSREHGIDISRHRSTAIDHGAVGRADLVLAMTERHVHEILELEPNAREKVLLLSRFADGSDEDVPDPIGSPKAEYEKVFTMIEGFVERALPRILEMAREDGR